MILVTGGAGYVGSVLVRALLARGDKVRVLDKCWFGQRPMQDIRDKIDLRQKDVRLADETDLDGVSGVVHLAGMSNDPTAEFWPELTRRINVVGTRHLAQLCIDCGVNRFVFASTASIYDRGSATPPLREEDESATVVPTATYAASKFQAERALLSLRERHQVFSPVILRKGTVYGLSHRMRYDLVVNTMVTNALRDGVITIYGDGTIWRPMVHVLDAAAAYLMMLDATDEAVGGKIFNVVEKNYQVKEIAAAVWFAASRSILLRFQRPMGLLRNYRVSGGYLNMDFGFKPQGTVEQEAARMVAYFDKHPNDLTGIDQVRGVNIEYMKFLVEMEDELLAMRGVV